jgi:hypothetical protein
MNDEEKDNLVITNNDLLGYENRLKSRVSFYDTIKKGPIQKYREYGIFPWKFIISILLIIFTICQAVQIVNQITTYDRKQIRGIYNLFIDDSDKTDPDYNRIVYLFSVEELRNHLKLSINVIYY